jgi:predicted nucleic-acid-binding Zn-ribbon protein
MANEPPDPTTLARLLGAQLPSQPRSPELTERERLRNKYQAVIARLWQKPSACPICGTDNWSVSDLVDVPIRDVAPDLAWAIANIKQAYVYVPVGCTNCGYTIFFHSGVLDARADEGNEPWRLK